MLNWIYLFILVISSGVGFYWGWRYVSRMKVIPRTLFILGALAVVLCFAFYPAVVYNLIPLFLSDFIAVIRWIPFACLFFGIAAGMVKSKFLPYELAVLSLLLIVLGISRAGWIYKDNQIDPSKFRMNEEGVCIQSTLHSCAPASAVTLLNHWGIKATEKEMAELCHTTTWGTETMDVAFGLAKKLRGTGLKVELISANWDRLTKLEYPCLVNIKLNILVDHMRVVFSAKDEYVIIADPLYGKIKEDKKSFLGEWRGSAIFIRP